MHISAEHKAASRRVLVVEDDEDVRSAIAGLLVDESYVPLCAHDGYEALALLERESVAPGLIILDLMMPGMNGPAFASAVRDDQRWRHIPILVVSADREMESVSQAIGAAALLPKPFDIERFNDLVRLYCRWVERGDALERRDSIVIDVPGGPLAPRKALLIDDSEVSLRTTAAALAAAGLEVVATLGLVGVGAALIREAPDVVVVGASMPVMFHRRLVGLLRERGAMCVVLYGDDPDKDARDRFGADGYVSMRASAQEVSAAIMEACRRRTIPPSA